MFTRLGGQGRAARRWPIPMRRCASPRRHILVNVLEVDFQARLDAFVADSDGSRSHGLPCWTIYRQVAGNSPAARQLFADAVRTEPVLLETVEQDPAHASEAISKRCDALIEAIARRQPMRFSPGESQQVSLANMAALLLAACRQDVVVEDSVGIRVYQLFHQSQMLEAMSPSAKNQPPRRLLGGWIRRNADTNLAIPGMWLGMRYDLKEGLAPAVLLVKRTDQYA